MTAPSDTNAPIAVYARRGVSSGPHWRRLLVAIAALMAVVVVAGAFVAPVLLRRAAEDRLAQLLGRRVTIERVGVNPFTLAVTVDGLQVLEADGRTPFAGFRRLYVDVQVASIFRRALVVRELRLESPQVRIERLRAAPGASGDVAVYNFSDVVTRLSARAKADRPAGGDSTSPLRFSLNNIRVLDGALVFDDVPLHARHQVTGFALGIPFLSTLPVDVDTFVVPAISGNVDGTPVAVKGRSKLFKDTIETVVELRVDALELTRYLPYAPVPLPLDVTVSSARLTVALDVWFVRPRAAAPKLLLRGQVALDDVSLRERDVEARPLLELRHLGVSLSDVDVSAGELGVDRVSVAGLNAHARRLPSGQLNFERLLPAPSATRAGEKSSPPVPARSGAEARVHFSLGELRLEDSALRFRDETMRAPFEVDVDDIFVSVRHLSNTPGADAAMEMTWQARPGGTFKQRGHVRLVPLSANGTASLDGIEPRRLAPYFSDRVGFEVVKGRLSAGTSYELDDARDHLSIRLRGGFVRAQDVALRWPRARTEVLRVPELALQGVDANVDGRTLSIAEVKSQGGRLRIARDSQGTVDLTALFTGPPAPAGPSAPGRASAPARAREPSSQLPSSSASRPWTVSVARLDVEGWGVQLTDRAVEPPASVSIAPLSLHATSLSSAPGSRANVDARMGLNKKGRLTVSGPVTLDPVATDLRVDLRTLELVPLQPYFRDQVNLLVTDGVVSVNGQVQLELPAKAADAPIAQPPPDRACG